MTSKSSNWILNYRVANQNATVGGAVLFGGRDDLLVGEVENISRVGVDVVYNRSVDGLKVVDAVETYLACVADLAPSIVLVRVGAEDLDFFDKEPNEFLSQYKTLLRCIRNGNSKCEIAILSISGSAAEGMNRSLAKLAAEEGCEFENLNSEEINNFNRRNNDASFVYTTGFVSMMRPRKMTHYITKVVYGGKNRNDGNTYSYVQEYLASIDYSKTAVALT